MGGGHKVIKYAATTWRSVSRLMKPPVESPSKDRGGQFLTDFQLGHSKCSSGSQFVQFIPIYILFYYVLILILLFR